MSEPAVCWFNARDMEERDGFPRRRNVVCLVLGFELIGAVMAPVPDMMKRRCFEGKHNTLFDERGKAAISTASTARIV